MAVTADASARGGYSGGRETHPLISDITHALAQYSAWVYQRR